MHVSLIRFEGLWEIYSCLGDGDQETNVSWWPKQSAFEGSGLNVGYWSVGCENWFQNRLQVIRKYLVGDKQGSILRMSKQWGTALRLCKETKLIHKYNEELSKKYLAGVLLE